MPKTKIHIEVDDSSDSPIVCSFPSGIPETAQFQWRKVQNTVSVYGRDDACHYKAQLTGSEKRRSKFCVGIYDRISKKLRILPASNNGSIFTVSQSVPAYTSSSATSQLNSASEQYRALFEDFGSAKKQRAIKSQEANRVSIDAVVGAGVVLDKSNLKMSDSNKKRFAERQASADADQQIPTSVSAVQEATQQWRKSFLPPFDEGAKDAIDVYRPNHMAGPGVWNYLLTIVEICMKKPDIVAAMMEDPKRKEPWKPSLQKLLEGIVEKSSTSLQTQLQATLLLHYFMTLYTILSKKRFVKAPNGGRFFGQPGVIAERFLDLFGTQTTQKDEINYTMSKANRDSCLVYILILYSVAGCAGKTVQSSSVEQIAIDLQLEPANCMHLLRQAGFTVKKSSSDGKITATLKTPLTFPNIKMARRGGGARGRS